MEILRVLYLEDDPLHARLYKQVIENEGTPERYIDVTAATDAEMGWSRYNLLKQQGGLVLAILDIVMQSGKSGLWLASKIHEDNPKLPILAITGNKRNVPEGSDLFEAVIEKTGNYARFREAVAYYLPK